MARKRRASINLYFNTTNCKPSCTYSNIKLSIVDTRQLKTDLQIPMHYMHKQICRQKRPLIGLRRQSAFTKLEHNNSWSSITRYIMASNFPVSMGALIVISQHTQSHLLRISQCTAASDPVYSKNIRFDLAVL